MSSFTPRTRTLSGNVRIAAGIDEVFPLFSPGGEELWVPGWEPEYLYPPGTEWEEGQIWRTQEDSGEAIWLTTRLDHARHTSEYHRIEPGRYVARVAVGCRPTPEQGTEVTIAYTYVGLSESGNRDIEAMTQEDYEAKMSKWREWIDRHLNDR